MVKICVFVEILFLPEEMQWQSNWKREGCINEMCFKSEASWRVEFHKKYSSLEAEHQLGELVYSNCFISILMVVRPELLCGLLPLHASPGDGAQGVISLESIFGAA